MTRQEHLQFCKKCEHRKFDSKQGVVCGITSKIADFEGDCVNFKIDLSVTAKDEELVIDNGSNGLDGLNSVAIDKLRQHQDFYYAIMGGMMAVLVSAVVWAIVTVALKYQIGYMAIGVGLLVGYSVQFFGAGIDKKFGILGAVLALLGCVLGNLFSQVGFIANAESLGYFETLTYLNPKLIIEIMKESFSPMDVLFYGIAIYEGYKFAFRKVSDFELIQLKKDEYHGYPSNYQYRLPLVVVAIIAIGSVGYIMSRGVNGIKTYKYESGQKMSEGELKKSKENGKWTYWYENGNVQLSAFYVNGLPDSIWQWFDENGKLTKSGTYKMGLENGVWMEYYSSGLLQDSGSYCDSRPEGVWKYWYENGNLAQIGTMQRGRKEGVWLFYYLNGQVSAEGEMKSDKPLGKWVYYFENGKINSEMDHPEVGMSLIVNHWDKDGNQLIRDGNGYYKSTNDLGQLLVEGRVENGKRVDVWKSYFSSGRLSEIGSYFDGVYYLSNAYNVDGEVIVENGSGSYVSYYADEVSKYEAGSIVNGLREGVWEVYFQADGTLFQEQSYNKGKLNGKQNAYYTSGALYVTGSMDDEIRNGEWTWYHENGNVSSIAYFVNNKKEGKQLLYSQAGDIIKEEHYKNDVLIQ